MAIRNTSHNGWNTKVFAYGFHVPSMDATIWLRRDRCPADYDVTVTINRSNGTEVKVKDSVRLMRSILPKDARFIGSDFVPVSSLFPICNLPSGFNMEQFGTHTHPLTVNTGIIN